MKKAFISLMVLIAVLIFSGYSKADGATAFSEIIPGIPVKNTVTLLDLGAKSCIPCKMMAPVFARAASQLEPTMRLAKLNTEQEQGLAAQHNIRSIPTLAVFKQGQEIGRMAGAMDLQNLITWARQFS